MSLELVDFSSTASADWAGLAAAIKGAGKVGVLRYCVGDKAPSGRGITAAEYAAYKAAGLEVALFYEGSASWMLGGYNAGVSAAQNAQANIVSAGMPPTQPVIFAHDTDPDPSQWAAIDACLNGAASVIGWPRVGAYGGWLLIDYLAGGGTVKLLCQTSAWEYGRGVHPAATLYQYQYNQYFAGTNCDLVRVMKEPYGQASLYVKGNPVPTTPAPAPAPKPTPKPTPAPAPSVVYPEGLDKGIAARCFGSVKASNGVTVSYSEGDELSALWLASGSYGRLIDVGVFNDSPTITRLTWLFSDGRLYHRPNANEPITLVKP